MKTKYVHLLVLIISVLPLIYLAFIWNTIPDIIPVHANINFEVDRTGNKNNLWLISGMLSGISQLVYVLLINIKKLDPKMKNTFPSPFFGRIAVVIVVFFSILNFIVIIGLAAKNMELLGVLLFPLLGLLFAFIGNYMHSIKPNYFAGMRLPWTLSSDYNWRKTHQLAGKLWFWGGLIIFCITIFTPTKFDFVLFIFVISVLTIIPGIYSYRLFKVERSKNSR